MGCPLMHITNNLLWRQKSTPYSREHSNATHSENCHNTANHPSLSPLSFHSKVKSIKNYSNPILGSQSLGQGFFLKQGFVSLLPSLLNPQSLSPHHSREKAEQAWGPKAWSKWTHWWSVIQESREKKEPNVHHWAAATPPLQLHRNKPGKTSTSLFAGMNGNSQHNANKLGLSLGRPNLPLSFSSQKWSGASWDIHIVGIF